MESTSNNNHFFLSEFKELKNELLLMKKRIVQLEESHEKQQERLDILERENYALKTEINNFNGNKEDGSVLKRKRKRRYEDQDNEEEIDSKSKSTSADKKKTKTNNNDDDDDEAVVLPQYDNGDSFDSLSDDLLHKIVEFDGNCYEKFGLINKRCKNIYDVKEYKLKKETFLYGYGKVDMILQRYLQKRKEGSLDHLVRYDISKAVIDYSRFDAIDWIFQLGDIELLQEICCDAAYYGKNNILAKVFLHCNLTLLDEFLNDDGLLCYHAANNGKLETLKWLRKYGAKLDADTFDVARRKGYYKIVQYLRAEGCPEQDED